MDFKNVKNVWFIARLIITAAAVGVLGYVLIDDDVVIVESQQYQLQNKVPGSSLIEAAPNDLEYKSVGHTKITPSCYKEKTNGFDLCIYSDEKRPQNNSDVLRGDVYECSHEEETNRYQVVLDSSRLMLQRSVTDPVGGVQIQQLLNDLNDLSSLPFECCGRIKKSHTFLLVGISFLSVALLGYVVLYFFPLPEKWDMTGRFFYVIVYLVATGFLGSALHFSLKSGPITCDENYEKYTSVLNNFFKFRYAEYADLPEQFKLTENYGDGFWMITAALVMAAVLALLEIVLLIYEKYPRNKETKAASVEPRVGSLFF